MSPTAGIQLELDDIQGGALHPRPSPYVGTYLLLRIDDREAGRELVRRLEPLVGSGRVAPDPSAQAWVTVAFTYNGLKALGVPQDSLDSFAPEFREGMAARATRARRRRRQRARTVGVAARNARCARGAGGALAGFRAA